MHGGRGDLAFGDDARRNLVQQWLKQMVSGAGNQLDVDIGPLELFDRVQSAESRSDDHHPVRTIGCGDFGLGAHWFCCSSAATGSIPP